MLEPEHRESGFVDLFRALPTYTLPNFRQGRWRLRTLSVCAGDYSWHGNVDSITILIAACVRWYDFKGYVEGEYAVKENGCLKTKLKYSIRPSNKLPY